MKPEEVRSELPQEAVATGRHAGVEQLGDAAKVTRNGRAKTAESGKGHSKADPMHGVLA